MIIIYFHLIIICSISQDQDFKRCDVLVSIYLLDFLSFHYLHNMDTVDEDIRALALFLESEIEDDPEPKQPIVPKNG